MVVDQLLERAGQALAVLYIAYAALGLLLPTVFGVHAVVLAVVAVVLRRLPKTTGFTLLVEFVYGFVNPIVYLLVLQPAFIPAARHAALDSMSWILFVFVWGTRFLGGNAELRGSEWMRRYVRGLLAVAFLCLAAFLAKDLALLVSILAKDGLLPTSAPPVTSGFILSVVWLVVAFIALGSLYFVPGMLIIHYLRTTESAGRWDRGHGFFLGSAPRPLTLVAGCVAIVTIAVTIHRPSEGAVERLLLGHRDAIAAAAKKHGVEPRLAASIVYVTQRDHMSPFARALERLAMPAWMWDPKNNYSGMQSFDFSVGIAQIKPNTALTALAIYAAATRDGLPPPSGNVVWDAVSGHGHRVNYKEFRALPRLDAAWQLPVEAVRAIEPPFRELVPKPQIVEALFDDRLNIELCALILSLYAVQWETWNAAWAIRDRPEILATLYQIGFERSQPKPDPRSNRFGDRVAEVYRSTWMQTHFGAPVS